MNTGDALWASARARALRQTRDLGGMIRFARQARGWRQDDLAGAVGYSRSTISRLETCARAGTDIEMIRRVAAAAGIPSHLLSELLGITAPPAATVGMSTGTRGEGGDDPMRRRQLITAGFAIPLSLVTGLDDSLALLPDPTSAATASEITTRLACARKRFDAGNLARLIADLPDLIATAHQAAERGSDPAAWEHLAACYDLATETLNKIGRYGSSRITADRATTFAALSGSPIAMAAAARSLGIVLRHEDRHHIADHVTLQAAARLESTGLVTPAQFAAFAQMLCTCAYNAAQAGDRDRALELITDAERAATRLPPHAVPGQPFTVTPAQVARRCFSRSGRPTGTSPAGPPAPDGPPTSRPAARTSRRWPPSWLNSARSRPRTCRRCGRREWTGARPTRSHPGVPWCTPTRTAATSWCSPVARGWWTGVAGGLGMGGTRPGMADRRPAGAIHDGSQLETCRRRGSPDRLPRMA
jgi:transcriptional regulator with XRE-family HTH domain